MHEHVEVVYENGVVRPLGPLPGRIQEHERLTLSIELAGPAAVGYTGDSRPALADEVRRQSLAAAGKPGEHEALAFIDNAADTGSPA
jgi:predicted DNA-binding antitoxin AbrB/MazE fold protein